MKKVVGYVMSVILALGIMLNAVACSGADGKSVKISFVTDCDDKIGVIYLDVGDYYGELPVPQNTDDYKFIGWYTSEEREGQYITPHTRVTITTDHKLYAKWEFLGKIVTITFKQGNGEEDIVREYKAGYPFGDIPTPSPRVSYAFEGWNNGKNYLTADDVVPDKDRNYIAKWTLVGPIPVSFETGCEITQPTLNLMVGEPYGSLPTPVRKDYEFLGWEYMSGKTPEIVTAETLVPAKEQVTLTAKWKYIGDVTLSFVSEGESFAPIKIKAGESLSGLPVPKSKDGYTFLGWYTQDKFYGERISEGDLAPDDNVTLYSRYEKNSEVDESRTTLVAMQDVLNSRSFAIKDGKLYVWGNNRNGLLGIDATDTVVTPTLLTEEMTFTEVTSGYNGIYALDSYGNPWMWGTAYNVAVTDKGTLITSFTYKTPTRMFEDGTFSSPKFKSISAGGYGSSELIYAIDSGNKLCKLYREQNADGEWGWAWMRLLESRDIKKLAVGGEHALAIDSEGKLWAWGSNRYGQLGDGTTTDRAEPTRIMSDKRFITVSAGKSHTLAIDYDGHLWVFGSSNTNGVTDYYIPTVIMADKTFLTVSAGDGYSFAIDSYGKAWSWGVNKYGRLGNGTTETNRTPQMIADGLTFAEISQVNGNHVLARMADDKFYAWGDNRQGSNGDGQFVSSTVPTVVLEDQTFKYVYAESDATFALDTDGRLYTWGKSENYGYDNDSPTHVEQDILFDTLSFGGNHILGIDLEGNLWAWGSNSDGQLGDGTKTDKAHPVQIMSGTKFAKISAGGNTSFAIDEDGKLWAWGNNAYGQLGNGVTKNNTLPENVKSSSRFTDICATQYQTYAVDIYGVLWACGAYGGSFCPNLSPDTTTALGMNQIPNGKSTVFVSLTNEDMICSSIYGYTQKNISTLAAVTQGVAYMLTDEGRFYMIYPTYDSAKRKYNSTLYCVDDKSVYKDIVIKSSGMTVDVYLLGYEGNIYKFSDTINSFEITNLDNVLKPIKNQDGNFTSMSCGNNHYCALNGNGKMYMWGSFDRDMLGLYVGYNLSPVQIQVG